MKHGLKTAVIAAAVSGVIAAGTGVAATTLITGKQVKNNSLTGDDIKDGTLRLADFTPAAVSLQRGRQGAPGQPGAPGVPGLIDLAKVSVVNGPASSVAPGEFLSVNAQCPPGAKAVGGGFIGGIAEIRSAGPQTSAATAWFVLVENREIFTLNNVSALAVCVSP